MAGQFGVYKKSSYPLGDTSQPGRVVVGCARNVKDNSGGKGQGGGRVAGRDCPSSPPFSKATTSSSGCVSIQVEPQSPLTLTPMAPTTNRSANLLPSRRSDVHNDVIDKLPDDGRLPLQRRDSEASSAMAAPSTSASISIATSGSGSGSGSASASSSSIHSASLSRDLLQSSVPCGISRRKIISKSQEAGLNSAQQSLLNGASGGAHQEAEEDVWYDSQELFLHHLREVLDKWSSLDDEIWGKIICMEKNRRVAKAYARVPIVTINGSEDGFDGYRIGLAGFDNPKRHSETADVKKHIGQGVKLKLDADGNILIKRVSTSPVYVGSPSGNFHEDNCFSSEIVKAHGQLPSDKPIKVFDMKRFTLNIAKEMRSGGEYADRRRLELQCFITISFVQQEQDPLETACWIMVINIVALDMLKNKLPPTLQSPGGMRGRSLQHTDNDLGMGKRFLSSTNDEHYPRLRMQHQLPAHSMADLSMLEGGDCYGEGDFDDRASIATYNYLPNYPRNLGGALPMNGGDYADLMHLPRRPMSHSEAALYRTLEAQVPYQDGSYFGDVSGASNRYYNNMMASSASRSATPMGLSAHRHAATEPNFISSSSRAHQPFGAATPSLNRFAAVAAQHRHSRSYDSGLESDLTSSSDETDMYNKWTSYSRLHMLPNSRISQHLPPQERPQRLYEWE